MPEQGRHRIAQGWLTLTIRSQIHILQSLVTHEGDVIIVIGQFLKKFNSFGKCSWRVVNRQKTGTRLTRQEETGHILTCRLC